MYSTARRSILAMRGRMSSTLTSPAMTLGQQAKSILASMKVASIKRLIFIVWLDIYDEALGKLGVWNRKEMVSALATGRQLSASNGQASLSPTLPVFLSASLC